MKQVLLWTFYRIVSNFNSQRALDSQSCFILSSQSLLRVIYRTCFSLLEDLSSELQLLIHVKDQRVEENHTQYSSLKLHRWQKLGFYRLKKTSRYDARGATPGNSWWGSAAPNPDPISNQKMSFFHTCFQTRLLKFIPLFRPGLVSNKAKRHNGTW